MKKGIILFAILGIALLVPLVSSAACTKEDVVKAVDHATVLLEKKGHAAFDELQNYRFCGEEGYVFVYDMKNICLFHPVSPKLVGKDQTLIQDAKGKYLVAEMSTKAKSPSGSGWVPYHWLNPKTGTIDAKCTYVKKCKMDGKDVWVASGVYGISEETCK